jgi:hypothetical protein
MVVAMTSAQTAPPGWFGAVQDSTPTYRGEGAAPPTGEAEQVRRLVSANKQDAIQALCTLGRVPPELSDWERDNVSFVIDRLVKVGTLPEKRAREQIVRMAYEMLQDTLCSSAFGIRTAWPEHFWDTLVGKLVYVAFYDAYGEDLLLNQDVAEALGLHLSRIGQVQRLGLLGYIENPWVAHRMQRRRRVAPYMIGQFGANEATH